MNNDIEESLADPLLYLIIDSFNLPVESTEGFVSGSTDIVMSGVLPGTTYRLKIKVADSHVDWKDGKHAALLLQIGARLFCVALAETRPGTTDVVKLFFLDSTKIPSLTVVGNNDFFPEKWGRLAVYKSMLPGLKKGFFKDAWSDEWTEMEHLKHRCSGFIANVEAGAPEPEAAKQVAESIKLLTHNTEAAQ